jgi:anhydro-N-acetylmuramic acid kinase
MRVAGIMSGTSLDGIDVAIIDIDGDGFDTVGFTSVAYPEDVRAALLAVSNRDTHTREIARLNFLLPELYAEAFGEACKQAGEPPSSVELIGCHGQTIYHEGTPADYLGRKLACTLQIGDGTVLAELTGVPVVSNFRPRDMAAGGQGAPLVPFVDYLLFRSKERTRVALNIGGIANITIIPADATPGQVVAFDTGPGNMVIDQIAARASGARFDNDGAMALRGEVNLELLETLLANPFYSAKPPKSAGREQYGSEFVDRLYAAGLSHDDAAATATMLTAATIADAIYTFGNAEETEPEVIVAGGGVHNPALMKALAAELPDCDVLSSAELGLDPDAKEAVAFAILAHETWHSRPANLPSATGARRQVVLGQLAR